MSNEILSQCWKLRIPQTAKFVLISLADQADNDGICWPSVAFICERTSLCDRAVQKSLKWLREHSAIRIEANAAAKGKNLYTVTPDNFTPEPVSPPHKVHPEPDSPSPERGSPPPPNVVREPPNDVRTNHKKPSTNHQGPKGNSARAKVELDVADLVAEGVDEQVSIDWLVVRKKKKLPLTKTAWLDVKAEAVKAGITAGEAVRIATKKGWAGFEATWNWKGANTPPGRITTQAAHTGFDQIDYQKDADEWNATN
ncbi:helix-turn-helix domain-containing protein [Lysobacter sp. FW306-1B-D06B]|uniref:helix-turn-helix domain-containing protein n=1 Tax=Lysobacter sp. FW306-1B-D06B TaxID=3140250 RepID=UPI003140962D